MKKAISGVLMVLAAGTTASLGCSSTQDGPIGSSSARVTSGGVTCTQDAYGNWSCTGDTGVGFTNPASGLGPSNGVYGFCGLKHIFGNFTTTWAGGMPAVEIDPNFTTNHWELHAYWTDSGGSTDFLQYNGAPEWICAAATDFTNFDPMKTGIVEGSVNTSAANPDDQYVPSFGYGVCPWTMIKGTASLPVGGSPQNEFGAIPGSTTDSHVLVSASAGGVGPLYSDTWCTQVGQAPRYGSAHPGTTGHWEYSLNGSTLSANIANTSDAFCYITQYSHMRWANATADQDEINIYDDGSGHWVLSKSAAYIYVSATCLPYDQSP